MSTLIFLLSLFSSFGFAQDLIRDQHIEIRLLAPEVFSASDETLMALHFKPEDHWHVYWKNPGDSGAAPKFHFSSKTSELGPVLWPFPSRMPVAHLTNFGYPGEVAYPFSVRPHLGAATVEIDMDLEWLVCKVECVPGFAKLKFSRPVHAGVSKWATDDQILLRQFSSLVPAHSENAPFKIMGAKLEGDTLKVSVQMSQAADFEKINLFPTDDFVKPAAPEKNSDTQEFYFKTNVGAKVPATYGFVATLGDAAWEFEKVSSNPIAAGGSESLWTLILFAALGGFILNLMPCVFPVISIKAFSLLKTQGSDRVKDCLLYSAGVLTTFLCLGALFLVLRSFGASVGWGFQLQSPLVILFLILLFWLMALNFLGVFEIGTSTMNVAGKFSSKTSSFGTGVLSVFIAAPCTGPFMGTALGAAVALPALQAMLIFVGLGFGLAFPFILFALFPRILSCLPRPGAWMEWLKEFFAFPLFATVIWLMWILGQQTQGQSWLLASAALLVISFGLWFGKLLRGWQQWIVWILVLATLIVLGQRLQNIEPVNAQTSKSSAWTPYDESKLNQARAAGKSVFVDFTAAWCITCQVNKQTVLDTQAGQDLFRKAEVLLMRADWTRYDPVITEALSRLGRSSVPVYAFYPSDGSNPKMLPQILTMSMLEELFPSVKN
jgi:thiol:disulfide interchange protein